MALGANNGQFILTFWLKNLILKIYFFFFCKWRKGFLRDILRKKKSYSPLKYTLGPIKRFIMKRNILQQTDSIPLSYFKGYKWTLWSDSTSYHSSIVFTTYSNFRIKSNNNYGLIMYISINNFRRPFLALIKTRKKMT